MFKSVDIINNCYYCLFLKKNRNFVFNDKYVHYKNVDVFVFVLFVLLLLLFFFFVFFFFCFVLFCFVLVWFGFLLFLFYFVLFVCLFLGCCFVFFVFLLFLLAFTGAAFRDDNDGHCVWFSNLRYKINALSTEQTGFPW